MLNTIKYLNFRSLGGKQGHEKVELQRKILRPFLWKPIDQGMHPKCERSGHQPLLTLIFNSCTKGNSILKETKNLVPLCCQASPWGNGRPIVKYRHAEELNLGLLYLGMS